MGQVLNNKKPRIARNPKHQGFVDRLDEALRELGIKKVGPILELLTGKGVLVNKALFSSYRNGRTLPRDEATADALAEVLNVSKSWLYEGLEPKQRSDNPFTDRKVLIIEDTRPMSIADLLERAHAKGAYHPTKLKHHLSAFAVNVRDGANIPWLLPPGHEEGRDVAVVDPRAPMLEKRWVYMEVKEGARYIRTFRRYLTPSENIIRLVPVDIASFKTYELDVTKETHIRIIGRVVEITRLDFEVNN